MTSIRPEKTSDAEYWEELVASGKSKTMATAEVMQRRKQSAGTGRSWDDEPTPAGRSGVDNASRAALQGLTFKFGDELEAGANAGLDVLRGKDFKPSYDARIKDIRGAMDEFRGRHPVGSAALEIAGALPTAFIPGAQNLGIVSGGALYGAASGAGGAGGGLGERATGAAIGGAAGALTGGAIKTAGAVGRVGYDLAKTGAKKLADSGVPQRVGQFLEEHPMGLSTKNVGGVVPTGGNIPPNASRATAPRIEAAVRDMLPRSPQERASGMMLKRLKADKRTPGTVSAAITASEKPRAIGDAAGENTLALQRWTRSVPSEARTEIPGALYERQAGMQERLVNDATELTGATRRNMPRAIAERAAQREQEAGQMFGALRQSPPVDASPLGELLATPAGQQAVKQAQRIAANERRPFPEDVSQLDFDTVHNIKLAFDDLLGAGPSSPLETGGLGKNNARVIRDLKNEYVNRADQLFPGYKDARDVFAGHSAIMNAMDEGSRFFKMPPDEASMAIQQLSASEKEAFVEGAVNALADRIEKGMNTFDKTRAVILPTQEQKRLRLLFPDDNAFQQFISRAKEEAAMKHSLNTTVGGSQTFEKSQEGSANEDNILDLGADAMRGRFGSMLDRVKNSAMAARARGLNTETANELGPMFTAGTNGDRQAVIDVLERLSQAEQREVRRRTTRAAASRPITGVGGGAIGSQR